MSIEKVVDRESEQKLYVQIHAIFKAKIESGEWLCGIRIPPEDELCITYNVSKATIRIAIAELVREGYLRRQQGKGTFVSRSIADSGMTMRTRLTEDMFGEGVKSRKEFMESGMKESTDEIKRCLKVEGNVYRVLCKRVVENEPAYLEESFIPEVVSQDIEQEDLCRTSFYDLIQEKTLRKIAKVIQTIEVTEITGDAAHILEVKEGAPGLLLHRLLIASDGSPIAYTSLIGSGVKYKLQTEFERIR